MAKPTLRSWLWLGVASIAFTSSLQTDANAQIIIGSGGPVHVTDINDIQVPQQFTFSTFTGSRLLMPDPTMDKGPRLYLKDPSQANKIQLIKPGEKPKDGYALIIPDESKPISLTPPPGTKIYLTPPRAKSIKKKAPKKVTKVAKVKPVATPAPEPEPQKIDIATAPVPAPSMNPVTQPETTVLQTAEKAAEQVIAANQQETPTAIAENNNTSSVEQIEKQVAENVTKIEDQTTKTVVELETPEPPPAPTQVAEVPVPPAIEAPKAVEVPVAAPKVELPETQVASAPAPKTKEIKVQPDTGSSTTVALLFGKDDARLNDDHRALIKGVIDQLEADPNSAVQLMAYAVANDRSKSRRLSLSRALAVRSYLLKHEVRNTRIQVRAMGDQVQSGKPDRVDLILVQP